MKIVRQLAIFLENQPGALYRICQDFVQKQINIKAISVSDTVDHAVVRLIVDKPIEAIHFLGEAGVLVVETDLLEIEIGNIPGELGTLCRKLLEMGVNIEYAYGSTTDKCGIANLYMRVVNPQKIIAELEKK